MAQEIPVYLFTGFMDSGKTTLVEETLYENDFSDGTKGLIIMCEDGDKEYNEDKLKTVNFKLTSIENEEDFTSEKLRELNEQYLPEQVFIEYNGTWGIDRILEAELPENWVIVQHLTTVDSTTFDLYMNNMRAIMQEQVFASDVVIFNRTDDDTDRGHLRRTIKNINSTIPIPAVNIRIAGSAAEPFSAKDLIAIMTNPTMQTIAAIAAKILLAFAFGFSS